ncbi:type II toxin-antitoxin system prevent-host-death family antitoxin [Streptomyces sp. NPDC048674]|uniref:type II toxin-antitoxin system prevent-host-death family antitoxin n=1 Tax=Streptomyces sp. NPDC048674 TaxID=3155491 RepID=UPI0034196A34
MSEREFREIGVSDARANMTDVIAEARLLNVDFLLTRRNKPLAALISIKRHNEALEHAALVAQLRTVFEEDTSVSRTFQTHFRELYDGVMTADSD